MKEIQGKSTWFELAQGSSYRGFELSGVSCFRICMVIEAASLGFGLCASSLCFIPTDLWPFYGFCWS